MKRKNVSVLILVISTLLTISIFSGTAVNINTPSLEGTLEVTKEVYNGEEWVNTISAELGDTVQFRINITYYNMTAGSHWAFNMNVTDILPYCLEYEETVYVSLGNPQITYVDNNVTWKFGYSDILYDGDTLCIIFNVSVCEEFCFCNEQVTNIVSVLADEHCTGAILSGSDDAFIEILCPEPGLDVDKKVWNGCEWVDEIDAYHCTIVRFNITVVNIGDINITNVFVNDTLPESLEYENDATVNGVVKEPDYISPDGKLLVWAFNLLEKDEVIVIEFNAHVIGMPCSTDINWAEATGESQFQSQVVTDKDSATVHVNGMCMDKKVWDDEIEDWMESTTTEVGKEVRFRITVYYYGDNKLNNISVRDELPLSLEYDAAKGDPIPEEPEVSMDKRTLWWNFSSEYDLLDGESLIIEFDAQVIENICEACINWANVSAKEDSIRTFYWDDPASVYIECAFIADAGGPYNGEVDEDIEITGSASGGSPPYTYEWDMDEDNQYDDATGETVSWSWSSPGDYTINLRVTDDDDDKAYDYASVKITIGENNPPSTPSIEGPSSNLGINTSYDYEFKSTDPDGHKVYYFINWGDGDIEEWIGPYNSGETVTLSHSWSNMLTTYNIQAKAKDIYDAESGWGSLSVTTPKNKKYYYPLLMKLLEHFAIFQKLLQILEKLITI